jgi:hypothetical protein
MTAQDVADLVERVAKMKKPCVVYSDKFDRHAIASALLAIGARAGKDMQAMPSPFVPADALYIFDVGLFDPVFKPPAFEPWS